MKEKEKNNIKRRKWTIRIAVIIGILLLFLLLCFCGRKDYGVSFQIGDNIYTMVNIHHGGKVEEPEAPTKEGYTFQGWYWNDKKFDFNSEITKDVILEARFEENVYTVTVDDGNGNQTELKAKHKEAIPEPKVGEKSGYYFVGWYVDGEEFHFEDGVTKDTHVEGKWDLNDHALYRVEHYLQEKDGTYSKTYKDIEILDGKTNSTVTPATHTYRGYQTPSKKSVKVEADGTTIVKYYYPLKTYTLVVVGGSGIDSVSGSGKYYYGDKVKIGYTLKDGYHFSGYSKSLNDDIFTMPDENVGIEVKAEANTDTPYRVEHYLQNTDGSYPETPQDVDHLTGTTDTKVTPNTKTYTGFTAPEEQEVVIDGKGTTVIKYCYTRNQYQLTLQTSKGVEKVTGTGTYYYGEEVTVSYDLKPGYSFVSWKQEGTEETISQNTITMPATDITLTAMAKAEKVNYHVIHYTKDLKSETYTQYKDEILEGITDTKVTPSTLTIPGFTAPKTETKTVSGDGTTVIEYRYDRNKYHVTVNAGVGILNTTGTGDYEFEEEVEITATLKPGYHDISWPKEVTVGEKTTVKVPVDGMDITATATPNSATPYTVKHYYMDVDGKYPEEPLTLLYSGTTDTIVEAPLQSKDGFTSPAQQQITITGDGLASIEYRYPRNQYTVTIEKTTPGVESLNKTEIKDIYFGSTVELSIEDIANWSTGYEFDKWSYEETESIEETLTFEMPSHDVTVTVVPKKIPYKVSFESENPYREKVKPQTYYYGDKITKISEGQWPHHDFQGWYLKESDGNLSDTAWDFDKDTMPNSDITLVAKWKIHNGTLNFVFGFEKEYKEFASVAYGTTVKDLLSSKSEDTTRYEAPTHKGYIFLGWYKSTKFQESEKVDNILEYAMPDNEGVTLYAKWRPIEYTIEFMPNGGEEVEHVKQERIYEDTTFLYHHDYHEEDIVKVPLEKNTYTRKGYTFKGWSTNKDATKEEYTDQQPVGNMADQDNENIQLYAVWVPNTYTVEYDVNKGNGSSTPTSDTIAPTTHTYDEISDLTKTTVTREGYDLLGWSKTKHETSQDSCEDCVKNANNLATGEKGDEKVTLYAVWKAHTYTVTYDANKGKGTSEPSGKVDDTTHTYDGHEKLSSNQYSRDGYTFKGWATKAAATEVEYQPGNEIPNLTSDEATVTLYAVWAPNTYTVTYDANVPETSVSKATGTVNNTTHTYDVESALSSDTYTRTGYKFLGWSTNKDATVADYQPGATVSTLTPSENITLYAVWEKITYAVTFDDKFGTKSSKNYTVEDSVTFLDPVSHDGYTFKGWYEKETETKVDNIPKGTTRSYDLEAKWETVPYNIKYEGLTYEGSVSQGTVPVDAKKTYTVVDETYTLPTPTRNGYTFDGWYTTNNYKDGTKVTSITTGSTGEKTFYAKWIIETYKITLVDKTLGTSSEASYNIEEGATLTPQGIQGGYTFDGWYESETFTGSPVDNISKGTTGEKTYYAKRTGISYTVIYSKDGSSKDKTETFVFGDKHTAAVADTIKNPYTVTFDVAGGKTVDAKTVNATVKAWKVKDSSDDKTYASGTEMADLITPTQTGQTVTLVPKDWNYPTVELPSTTKDADNEHYVEYQLDGWYQENTKWTEQMPVTNNIKLVAKWKNVIDTDTYINDSWKNNTGNILEEKCTSSGFFTKTYSCSYSETQGTIYNLPTMTNQNLKIDIQAAYKKVDDVITNTSSLINSTKKLLGASGVQSIVLEYSDTTGSKTTITLNKGNVTNDNVYEKIKELFIAMTNTSKAENTSDRKLSSLNGKKFTLKVVASEDSIISKNKSSEIIYTVSFAATNHVVTNAYWQNFSSKIANNIISNYQKKETSGWKYGYYLTLPTEKDPNIYLEYHVGIENSSLADVAMERGFKTAFWNLLGNTALTATNEGGPFPNTPIGKIQMTYMPPDKSSSSDVEFIPTDLYATDKWALALSGKMSQLLKKFGDLTSNSNAQTAGSTVEIHLEIRPDWELADDFTYPMDYTLIFRKKADSQLQS